MYSVIRPLIFAPLLVFCKFARYCWKPLILRTVSTMPSCDVVAWSVRKLSFCTVLKSACEFYVKGID